MPEFPPFLRLFRAGGWRDANPPHQKDMQGEEHGEYCREKGDVQGEKPVQSGPRDVFTSPGEFYR